MSLSSFLIDGENWIVVAVWSSALLLLQLLLQLNLGDARVSFDEELGEKWNVDREDNEVTEWNITAELERLVEVAVVVVVAAGGDERENVGENGLQDGDSEQYEPVGLAPDWFCSL